MSNPYLQRLLDEVGMGRFDADLTPTVTYVMQFTSRVAFPNTCATTHKEYGVENRDCQDCITHEFDLREEPCR